MVFKAASKEDVWLEKTFLRNKKVAPSFVSKTAKRAFVPPISAANTRMKVPFPFLCPFSPFGFLYLPRAFFLEKILINCEKNICFWSGTFFFKSSEDFCDKKGHRVKAFAR